MTEQEPDVYRGRCPEFPNITAEDLESWQKVVAYPFWAHKYVMGGQTAFHVTHSWIQYPTPVLTFPAPDVFWNLEQIEAALPIVGASDDQAWIIERIGGTTFWRWFKIHHNPGVSDKCPYSGSYANLHDIASRNALSYIYNNNTMPISCVP